LRNRKSTSPPAVAVSQTMRPEISPGRVVAKGAGAGTDGWPGGGGPRHPPRPRRAADEAGSPGPSVLPAVADGDGEEVLDAGVGDACGGGGGGTTTGAGARIVTAAGLTLVSVTVWVPLPDPLVERNE